MGDFQKGAVDCETMSKLMQCGWIYTTFHEMMIYFWSFFVEELKSYLTIGGISWKGDQRWNDVRINEAWAAE